MRTAWTKMLPNEVLQCRVHLFQKLFLHAVPFLSFFMFSFQWWVCIIWTFDMPSPNRAVLEDILSLCLYLWGFFFLQKYFILYKPWQCIMPFWLHRNGLRRDITYIRIRYWETLIYKLCRLDKRSLLKLCGLFLCSECHHQQVPCWTGYVWIWSGIFFVKSCWKDCKVAKDCSCAILIYDAVVKKKYEGIVF